MSNILKYCFRLHHSITSHFRNDFNKMSASPLHPISDSSSVQHQDRTRCCGGDSLQFPAFSLLMSICIKTNAKPGWSPLMMLWHLEYINPPHVKYRKHRVLKTYGGDVTKISAKKHYVLLWSIEHIQQLHSAPQGCLTQQTQIAHTSPPLYEELISMQIWIIQHITEDWLQKSIWIHGLDLWNHDLCYWAIVTICGVNQTTACWESILKKYISYKTTFGSNGQLD